MPSPRPIPTAVLFFNMRELSCEDLYIGAGILGFFTWAALNRRPIAGDTAVIVYAILFGVLYALLRHSGFLWLVFPSPITEHALATSLAISGIYATSALLTTVLYRLSPWHPLASYPGPRGWHVSSLVLSYYSFCGRRHLQLHELHMRYGPYMRIGPDTISVSSLAGQQIYSVAARMPKSESYRAPGGPKTVSLFFKQKSEKLHADRKRVWGPMFTKEGYAPLFGLLENRTTELIECMERRAQSTSDGNINLTECFYHWSYDFMGDMVLSNVNQLELMKNGDQANLVMGGKLAIRVMDSIGQTPWLFDIIWYIPAGGALHRMVALAARVVQTRLKARDLPPLSEHLISVFSDM